MLISILGLQSFCRKFVWHRECLWPEELPEACMLVLAGEDDLVPSALVKDMLHIMNHPCEVWLAHPALCSRLKLIHVRKPRCNHSNLCMRRYCALLSLYHLMRASCIQACTWIMAGREP